MGRTVLLLDDSASIRYIIRAYLMGLKLDFLDADCAERALRLLETSPVDLIIADVNLPGMNGLEFVRQVRADDREQLRRVPVIVLTGDREPDLEARAMEVGATTVMHKPIGDLVLTDLVCRCLKIPLAMNDDLLSPAAPPSRSALGRALPWSE